MTGWRVTVDADMCTGSGMCLGVAPGYFIPGPGHTRVRVTVLADDDPGLAAVRDAVDCCPMEALAMEALGTETLGTAQGSVAPAGRSSDEVEVPGAHVLHHDQ